MVAENNTNPSLEKYDLSVGSIKLVINDVKITNAMLLPTSIMLKKRFGLL
jgi:hypothetical protein